MDIDLSNVKIEPVDYGEDEVEEVIVDGFVDMDDMTQLVVDPEELGILGNVMNSYDDMQDKPDSNGVEFLLGNSGQNYIISVKRVSDANKTRPQLSAPPASSSRHNDEAKQHKVDLSLVKEEPIDDDMHQQFVLTQGLECVETSFNEIISEQDVNEEEYFEVSDNEENPDEIVISDSEVTTVKNKPQMFKCAKCKYSVQNKDKLFDHISKKHGDKENTKKEAKTKKSKKDESINKIISKIKTKMNAPRKGANKITELKFKMKNKQLEKFLNLLTEEDSDTVIIKSAKTEEEQKCSFCDFTSHDINEYFRHVGSEHAKDPVYSRNEKGELRTDCMYCDYKGAKRKNLLCHLKNVHSESEPRFKCDQCDYRTHKKNNFDRHVEVVHEKRKDVKCPECGYLTTRNYLLQKHILYKHKGIMPYRCTEPGCNFGHQSSSICRAHIMEVHRNYRPYKCNQEGCEFTSSARFLLKKHILSVHKLDSSHLFPPRGYQKYAASSSSADLHSCPYCDYVSPIKFNIQKHVTVVHFGLKPFKCDECDYSASSKPQLTNHVQSVHRGIFSFICDACEFKCNTKQRFIMHYNAKHLKERPYKCHLCPYKGGQPIHLKRHIEVVHKGEKPHFCVYCQFNTAHRGNLKAHLKAIHKVDEKDVWEVMKTCVDTRKEKKNRRNKYVVESPQPGGSTDHSPSPRKSTKLKPNQPEVRIVKGKRVIHFKPKASADGTPVDSIVNSDIQLQDLETLEASLVLEQIGNHQYSNVNSSYQSFDNSVNLHSSTPHRSANLTKSFIVQL